ncbi:MAG TPA: glycosyltransferase family 2 protein [Candidatus Andersenbacteria bacterium]|nr:MAG: hypothetical protein A2854_04590 [Parcubacteria group bacterium RIFCSPHIGHO2_01_FULL_56_18]HLD25607.1 glycosyltransferase family 2 protein [Candidatus Andersenbacteria bacterium]
MSMGKPLVTVLLATRNGERLIAQAVASVLKQSYEHFELVIIDDASTDTTAQVVAGIKDRRIRFLHNDQPLGLTRSLNRGLVAARGEFIARIDDDDIWVGNEKLTKQVDFLLAHPRVGLVGTQNVVVSSTGWGLYWWRVPTHDAGIRQTLLRRNHFVHSGVMIRRAALREVGPYGPNIRYAQDYELWLRIGKRWQLANLPDVYVKQRLNQGGVTSRNRWTQFISFLKTAWLYRHDYPGFWRSVPVYLREAALNLLPRRFFHRFGVWLRPWRITGSTH